MFDRLEIKVLPPGPRWAAQARFMVNGEDLVEEAVDEGGRGPFAADVLPAGRPRSGPSSCVRPYASRRRERTGVLALARRAPPRRVGHGGARR
ncbi:hypothetical protein ELQ39_20250 [Streptomyces sp. GB4-14]|nr:hypothetical protein [Streptomyces sp. GB4-14]